MPSNRSANRDVDVQTRPYWLLIALAPVIPALLNALRSYLDSRLNKGRADWGEVILIFVGWVLLGAFTPIIYVLAHRYRIRRPTIFRALSVHLFSALTLGIVWGVTGVFLGRLSRAPGMRRTAGTWILITLPYSLLVYVLMLGCVYAFMYYREARERESQEARLAAQLAEARLNALRAQLNPHFLFNSLNTITVLMRDQKTQAASEVLELLSDVLRQVLKSKQSAQTRLSEELAFIEKYLSIEQVRFPDRLQVKWRIQPAVQDALVPEFILQPLVENAVRHGVARRAEVGIIEIAAKEWNGELVLIVRDNGPGYRPATAEGLGLTNTRERLATLYGNAGQLALTPAEEGGTVATVRFPVDRETNGE